VKLVVRRGEREERVEVEPDGGGYRVRVGDADYRVDVARAGGDGGRPGDGGVLSLRIEGGQYEAAVHRLDDRRWRVSTAGGAGEVEVDDPLGPLARRGGGRGGVRRAGPVVAAKPGRVLAVLVDEGAAVREGQGVVVVEAMKMENEIAADRDGTVGRLHVAPGQPVERGDPLFEVTAAGEA
jgi:pyruvate carboxylase subunit B